MTIDSTRAPTPLGAPDAVQQLRTAWVQLQRAVQIINDHGLFAVACEAREAVEAIKAAQSLIHGVADAVNREYARVALTPAASAATDYPGIIAGVER